MDENSTIRQFNPAFGSRFLFLPQIAYMTKKWITPNFEILDQNIETKRPPGFAREATVDRVPSPSRPVSFVYVNHGGTVINGHFNTVFTNKSSAAS